MNLKTLQLRKVACCAGEGSDIVKSKMTSAWIMKQINTAWLKASSTELSGCSTGLPTTTQTQPEWLTAKAMIVLQGERLPRTPCSSWKHLISQTS